MKTPSIYDDIRPFDPEELPAAFERLLSDAQFQQVLGYLYPGVPLEAVKTKMMACKTNLEFQLAFCYGFLKDLMAKASKGFDMNVEAVDVTKRYTFVSNHRDIVLDSALLDVLLYDADDVLLLTSLASDQAIRTAHIVGAMGVVIHNAKPLSQTMIDVANSLGIPLVSSPLAKYEACVRIHDALTQEK